MTKTRGWVLVIAVVAWRQLALHRSSSRPRELQPSVAVGPPRAGVGVSDAGRIAAGRSRRNRRSVPGSTKKYTPKEIDDLLNPPDWFPDEHKPAPSIVQKGHGMALACGSCHLMSGLGHPESSDVTGSTAAYIVQQMEDFKSGARKDYARMNGIAGELSDQEIQQAAEYFASLPRATWSRVVEAAMVPKTFVGQGRMRFVDPKATGMEPIGKRIITLPEDQDRARLRDPKSGFVRMCRRAASRRARRWSRMAAAERRSPCSICHGDGLKGSGQRAAHRRGAPDLSRAAALSVQGRRSQRSRTRR